MADKKNGKADETADVKVKRTRFKAPSVASLADAIKSGDIKVSRREARGEPGGAKYSPARDEYTPQNRKGFLALSNGDEPQAYRLYGEAVSLKIAKDNDPDKKKKEAAKAVKNVDKVVGKMDTSAFTPEQLAAVEAFKAAFAQAGKKEEVVSAPGV